MPTRWYIQRYMSPPPESNGFFRLHVMMGADVRAGPHLIGVLSGTNTMICITPIQYEYGELCTRTLSSTECPMWTAHLMRVMVTHLYRQCVLPLWSENHANLP